MKRILFYFSLLLNLAIPGAGRALPLPDSLPPLEQLEQAALSRIGLDPGKISRWDRNARRAVALPRLQVGYEQKAQNNNTAVIQDSISVTSAGITIGPESNRIDQDFGNDRGFEVKAVWALDELLFNRDELEISREARDLLLVRGRLQAELHQTYYDLKTQLLRLTVEPESTQDPYEILRAQELMDKLNSLSAGEFYRLVKHPPPESQPQPRPEEAHDTPAPFSKNRRPRPERGPGPA